jgi:hypothetical protein
MTPIAMQVSMQYIYTHGSWIPFDIPKVAVTLAMCGRGLDTLEVAILEVVLAVKTQTKNTKMFNYTQ